MDWQGTERSRPILQNSTLAHEHFVATPKNFVATPKNLSRKPYFLGLSGFPCSAMSHHLSFLWLASIAFRKKHPSSGSP